VSIPALIPGTFTGEARRRVPKVSKNKVTPLWTVEPDGQLFQGIIRVPVRLCNTQEHTNARFEFEALIVANLERWAEWRKRRGWFISEKPRISGPFDPPEGDRLKDGPRFDHAVKRIGRVGSVEENLNFDYPQEFKWYVAEARFRREEPVFVKMDDFLFLRHLALTYEIDPDRDPMPVTQLPEPEKELTFEGGLDPMQEAETERQRLGLKRADYLMGKLWEPL